MTTIAELKTKLSMDAAEFIETAKKTEQHVSAMRETFEAAGETLKTVFEVEAIKRGAEAVLEFAEAGAEAAEQQENFARRVGVSVEEIQALAYASASAGVQQDSLRSGTDHLARVMSEATRAGSEQAAVFAAMGIQVKDSQGNLRSTADVLADVADRFKGYEDGAAKAALAQQLFGRGGADMIPLLDKGAQGLRDLADEAKNAGVVLDGETTEGAESASSQFSKMHLVTTAMQETMAAKLNPTFEVVSEHFAEAAQKGGALQAAVAGVAVAFETLVSAGIIVKNVISDVGIIVEGVGVALVDLVEGNFRRAGNDLKAIPHDLVDSTSRDMEAIAKIWSDSSKEISSSAEQARKTPPPVVTAPGKAPVNLVDAQAKADLALLRESIRERQAELAGEYRDGEVSLSDYFSRRLAIENEAYDKEASILSAEIARVEAMQRKGGTAEEQSSLQSKHIELVGQLALVQARQHNAQMDNLRDEALATRQLNDALAETALRSQETIDKIRAEATRSAVDFRQVMGLASQQDVLNAERDYQNQLYEIDRSALESRIERLQPYEIEKAAELYAQLEALRVAHNAKLVKIDQAAKTDAAKYAIQAADAIRNDMGSSIADFIEGTKSLKDAWHDLTRSILKDLTDIIIKQEIEKTLGVGGTSGSGILGSALGALFGGPRAGGGPVDDGHAFLVGENGPELFVPPGAGMIVPNHELARTGSGGNVTIVVQAPQGRVSQQTQLQIAAAAHRGLAMAAGRNGLS